jgi:hypothetical protein
MESRRREHRARAGVTPTSVLAGKAADPKLEMPTQTWDDDGQVALLVVQLLWAETLPLQALLALGVAAN